MGALPIGKLAKRQHKIPAGSNEPTVLHEITQERRRVTEDRRQRIKRVPQCADRNQLFCYLGLAPVKRPEDFAK